MATAPSVELGPLGLENPMGTDGFEFVEYAAPDPELLRSLFAKMGFPAVARHKRKNVTLHRQGDATRWWSRRRSTPCRARGANSRISRPSGSS